MQDGHAPVCVLQVGIASGQYTAIIPASQTNTYTSATICGTFAANYSYIDPGLFSSANLTKLEPATKYYYRVGAIVSLSGSPLTLYGSAQQLYERAAQQPRRLVGDTWMIDESRASHFECLAGHGTLICVVPLAVTCFVLVLSSHEADISNSHEWCYRELHYRPTLRPGLLIKNHHAIAEPGCEQNMH